MLKNSSYLERGNQFTLNFYAVTSCIIILFHYKLHAKIVLQIVLWKRECFVYPHATLHLESQAKFEQFK